MEQNLQQIKDQYAKELGYKNFRDLALDTAWWDELDEVIAFMNEVSLRYATACCKATQEKQKKIFDENGLDTTPDQILSPNNIVIL